MAGALLLVGCFVLVVNGLNNGLGGTPQMGYNSWYDLMCDSYMNENTIKKTADAFISKGLHALGYTYVNLDDCWAGGRYPNGTVYSDPLTFPSGMKNLADYVHSKGLKFGLYTDRGTYTCAQRPGALNYEVIDAKTYASWGVDYLKEDSCFATQDHEQAFAEYGKMRDALNATGRPIFFSLCGWNDWYAPRGYSLGNSWRIGPDDTVWESVLQDINANVRLAMWAGPGGWNDPCLLLGDRLPYEQAKTQFSLWSVLAAPLLISANIRDMAISFFSIYTNKEVIAVDQDPMGKQGFRLYGSDLKMTAAYSVNVIGRPLFDGSWALVFVNMGTKDSDITCDSSCLSLMGFSNQTLQVRDLWTHQQEPSISGSYTVKKVLAAGSSKMVKFTPK